MCASKAVRDWKLRVNDILTSIEKIRSFVAGMTYEEFCKDAKTVTQ